MDVNELQKLIQMLRAEGVEYLKDGQLELYLRPSITAASIPHPRMSNEGSEAEPLPEVFKKLHPNYSHPALFPRKQ